MKVDKSKLLKELKDEFPNKDTCELGNLVAFIDAFSIFFPHFVSDHHLAAQEMDDFIRNIYEYPILMVDKPKTLKFLKRFAATLRLISQHDLTFLEPLWEETSAQSLQERIDRFPDGEGELEEGLNKKVDTAFILDFLLKISAADQCIELNEDERKPIKDIINQFEQDVEQAISVTPKNVRVNWEAINIVHSARTMWFRNSPKRAPYSLNPTSPFVPCIEAAFKLLDIEDEPLSTFKRWEKYGKAQAIEEEKNITKVGEKRLVPYDLLIKD